jgi:NADPH2:quinone reductase
MKSIYLKDKGQAVYGEVPKPECKDDQVLIKVDCCVLNPSDVLFMTGHTMQPRAFPFTPGWEGAGTIVEVGRDLQDENLVGQRVGFNR